MDVFKWTVPEPDHRRQAMRTAEFEHWTRVRRRGPEWFVVGKGMLFLLVVPPSLHLLSASPIGFDSLTGSWVAGLVLGTIVWLRREKRYERALTERPHQTEAGEC